MSLAPDLLAILVCPKCKGPLEHRPAPAELLVCHACRLMYVRSARARSNTAPLPPSSWCATPAG